MNSVTEPTTRPVASGGMVFAATMMVLGGLFQFFLGIAAIAKDQIFVGTPNYAFRFDTKFPRSKFASSQLRLTYIDGQGVLRAALSMCTQRNFVIRELTVDHRVGELDPGTAGVWLNLQGTGSVTDLTASLGEVRGVVTVTGDDANNTYEEN